MSGMLQVHVNRVREGGARSLVYVRWNPLEGMHIVLRRRRRNADVSVFVRVYVHRLILGARGRRQRSWRRAAPQSAQLL